MKLIAQGAEAKLYKEGDILIKDRIKKSYRIEELDKPIRKRRSKKEAKILKKEMQAINARPALTGHGL